jgi:hypothetical protein
MRLTLEQIDPQIARRIAEGRAAHSRRYARELKRTLNALGIPDEPPAPPRRGWRALLGKPSKEEEQREQERQAIVLREEMRLLLPLLSLSKAEQSYVEILLQMMDERAGLDEIAGREMLAALNRLIEDYRQISAQTEAVLAAMRENPMRTLEEERARLAARLEQTADPVARQTLQRSLEISESRIENARALATALERLDAQEEMCRQTLASVRSSLSRIKTSRAALTAGDQEEIGRVAENLNARAHAVEQAIQEVMSLRL